MGIFHLPDAFSPALNPSTAVTASSLLTLTYVGGLYVSTRTRVGHRNAKTEDGAPLRKDDAVVIKARMKAVALVSAVSMGLTGGLLLDGGAFQGQHPFIAFFSTLRALGIPLPVPTFLTSNLVPLSPSLTLYTLHHFLPALLSPLLLTSILFAGPLYVCFLDKELPGQVMFSYERDIKDRIENICGLRNFVVGPTTEEIVFRACILALHSFAGFSKVALVFATPLYFGIAHLHHAYEIYVGDDRSRAGLKRGLVTAAVQFTYTSVFGWYANFLFLRSGTYLSPSIAHTFCNVMGLPQPSEAAQRHPQRKRAIYVAHLLGIAGFAFSLFRVTKPGIFGGSMYWS